MNFGGGKGVGHNLALNRYILFSDLSHDLRILPP